MAVSPEHSVAFDASSADLAAFGREVISVDPTWKVFLATERRRQRWRLAAALIPLAGACALLAAAAKGEMREERAGIYACILLAIGASSLWAWNQAKTQIAGKLQNPYGDDESASRTWRGTISVDLNSDGIRWRCEGVEVNECWSRVTRVDDLPSCIAIPSLSGGVYLVPNAAFAAAEQRAAFLEFAQRSLATAGADEHSRIRAYPRVNDAKCPHCNYQLRGSRGNACPERGLRLSFENVPEAERYLLPAARTADSAG